jgi:NAD(P)H dehydrogenase (quinone)
LPLKSDRVDVQITADIKVQILIIYCHPVEASYAAALHAAVLDSLNGTGYEVTDVDLYADGFDPVLSPQESVDYRNVGPNASNVQKYVHQLSRAEGLILIYPSWWYGFPAMLKGYFDRVWLPGVAFDISVDGNIATDRLYKLRRIVVITTYGSPRWMIRFFMGDPTRKLISRGFRRICGRDCRIKWYVKYGMDKATSRELQRFLDKVRGAIVKALS